jgi:site-specific DNA-methyltransferase (adenine-specific)
VKPYYNHEGITIYHGDCREVLPILQADIIVTDPPYGTGGWRRTTSGAGSNPSGALVQEAWDDGAVDWIGVVDAPVLTFWPPAKTSALLNAANAAGLTKHRALYMRKRDPKPMPGGRTRWSVEPIWALSRDGFLLYGGDDVIEVSTPRLGRDADATGHPYEKPIEALLWLIGKTSAATICDPFMGSGTTLRAAKNLGRRAIGIELEERYCEIAARRLGQEVLPW